MKSINIIFLFQLRIFICLYPFVNAQSQENSGLAVISDLLEDLTSSEPENTDTEEIAEDLYYLLDHPLNLNRAGEEELRQLHVLNDFQIYTLLEYVRDYGPILSIHELQTIVGFSEDIISKIQPFVYISPVKETTGNRSSPGKPPRQQIIYRYARDVDQKKGFNPDTIAHFLGNNRTMMLRYEIKSGENRIGGFTLEQDAGESFRSLSKSIRPDFMSAFCEIHTKTVIKQVNIGDFRASYGQGLALSGYPQRKGSAVLIKPVRSGIRKYSSTSENDLFRGAAIRLGWKNVSADLFYSRLNRDASIYLDSSRYFRSLSSTGLHRTYAELETKDALLQSSFGVHTLYKTPVLDLGFTCFSENFDADYLVKTDPFHEKRFRKGDPVRNLSIDFKLNNLPPLRRRTRAPIPRKLDLRLEPPKYFRCRLVILRMFSPCSFFMRSSAGF